MPSITIKDFPYELLARLRQRAARHRRSVNEEIVHLLDRVLSGAITRRDEAEVTRGVEAQVHAWRQLAGRWESEADPAREVEQIYAARALPRPGERG
jgi:plasmid stability protein